MCVGWRAGGCGAQGATGPGRPGAPPPGWRRENWGVAGERRGRRRAAEKEQGDARAGAGRGRRAPYGRARVGGRPRRRAAGGLYAGLRARLTG